MRKPGNVFSLINNIYALDDAVYCSLLDMDRFWHNLKIQVPIWLEVKKHDFVTDLKGSRLCRPVCYDLNGFFVDDERVKALEYICAALNLKLRSSIYSGRLSPEDYPNAMVALGGANELSVLLQHEFKDNEGKKLRQGAITMAKVVKNGILVDFKFINPHPLHSFNPKEMKVILVEDFVGTGLSIFLAIKRLESMGAKVVAIVSLFNTLGYNWPFSVPINITFQNLDFTKYPAGTCPYCQLIYSLKKISNQTPL